MGREMSTSRLQATNPLLHGVAEAKAIANELFSEKLARCGSAKPRVWLGSEPCVADVVRRDIVRQVLEQVHNSYLKRDVRNPCFRDFTISANRTLHFRRDRRGHDILVTFGSAPGATSRSILVAAPMRTGRRVLADLIESMLGRKPAVHRIPVEGGRTEVVQLPLLRVVWPARGSFHGFANGLLAAFDAALDTDYARLAATPLFSDLHLLVVIRCLAIVTNLGLLVVERINTAEAITKTAAITWTAIADFAGTTGIPVLCMATPGAAIAALQSGLSRNAPFEICPSESFNDDFWLQVCGAIYAFTVGAVFRGPMPNWLPKAAHRLTHGYPGLISKVLTSIAVGNAAVVNSRAITRNMLTSSGKRALVLDQPSLDQIAAFRRRRGERLPDVRIFGDWLPLHEFQSSHVTHARK